MDQNLPKRTRFADRSKIKLGLFLVEIFEFLKNEEKFGGNKVKSVATVALIPYDVCVSDPRARYGYLLGTFEFFDKEQENNWGKFVGNKGQIRVKHGSDTI